jgi:hypothetical protein
MLHDAGDARYIQKLRLTMDCAAQQSLFYGFFAVSQAIFVQCTKFFLYIKLSHNRASQARLAAWLKRTILIGKMVYGNINGYRVLDSPFCPILPHDPAQCRFCVAHFY